MQNSFKVLNLLRRPGHNLKAQVSQDYFPLGLGTNPYMWWRGEIGLTQPLRVKSDPNHLARLVHRREIQFETLRLRFGKVPEPQDLAKLAKWSHQRFPEGYQAASEPLPFRYQQDYLILARLLIYQNRFREALGLLEALQQAAHKQGRSHSLIKILLVMALAQKAAGKETERINTNLNEALTLAEPGGYIRVFVEEGPVMRQLLSDFLPLAACGNLRGYLERLLAAFEVKGGTTKPQFLASISNKEKSNSELLDETLSERELEVLHLIADGASNQAIATQLVVTLSTVKKHATNIFTKLGVSSRTQAIARATELGLS
jgi:LuxR family maltose regulon positive regulatory protein